MLPSLPYEVANLLVVWWLLATSPSLCSTSAASSSQSISPSTKLSLSSSSAASASTPFAPNISHYSATESNNSKNMNKQIEVVRLNNTQELDAKYSAQDLYLDKHNVVATTPKIAISSKAPSRYEEGLEDYEEAVARVEKTKENQAEIFSEGWSSVFAIFNFLHSAWMKSPVESENINGSGDSARNRRQLAMNDVNNSTEVAEGRYIKGDPLRGYYDFIITEGSYKFWAAFQLFTAGLMIYSTLAAIYYSKVNPVVGDYDYYSYLGGRSMADDPEPLLSSSSLSRLANSQWFESASHSFQFVLDAIEKLPDTVK